MLGYRRRGWIGSKAFVEFGRQRGGTTHNPCLNWPMNPDLSICIPTFTRARYLEFCLEHLAQVATLPIQVEIVVSDNASTDETKAVVQRAAKNGLPVRYFRQSSNVGAEANMVSALRAARGEFCVYVGDDDQLRLEQLVMIVELFRKNPNLVCVQAPWESWDDEENRGQGPFYDVPAPACFGPSNTWDALEFLLTNGVFPEIGVYRTSALHAVLDLP